MEILITLLIAVAVIVVLYVIFKIFKLVTRIIIVAVFLAVAYFTNPGLEKHQAAVARKAEKDNTRVRDKHVAVKDLKVFSLTQITKDETRTVGVGAFTQVWIVRALN